MINPVEVINTPASGPGPFVVIAEQQPPLELPTDTAERRCCQHALRRAAGPKIQVNPGLRIGGGNHACHVAIGNQHDAAAERTQFGDQLVVARPVQHAGDNLVRRDALGLGNCDHIVRNAAVQVDDTRRIARSDGHLVHVYVGRIEQAALLGNRQHRERVGTGLRRDRRAFQRIKRDVDPGAGANGASNFFADIEHRGFIALALPDDDGSIKIEFVERTAHRIDRRCIRRLLIAAPDQFRRGDCSGFGDTHHLQHKNAVEGFAGLDHFRSSLSP